MVASMRNDTKQVLVWRKDLRNKDNHKVRTGKVAAQLAHASMKAILDNGYIQRDDIGLPCYIIPMTAEMDAWLAGIFTKICVSVDSEEELLSIYEQALEAGLVCSLIQDAGLTEFGGVPTYTAVAVGPAKNEDVDKITSGLKLL